MMMRMLHKLRDLITYGFLYFIFSFILILFIPVWIMLIGPHFKKIPNNFTYAADIFSLDNFYNEQLKKFEGERISKTVFGYRVVSRTSHYLVIEVVFDVRQLDDSPIFSVSRLYYVNPYNGQHVVVDKLNKRYGYLFSPSYSNRSSYFYWHINYDAPALLKYIKTEKINGLTVYKYHAYYEADQTENLGHLPGVPEKRGVRTNINLDLWIEPISGWLVKYEDNTLAYYYDKVTGQFIAPWNKFSNRYTQTSIFNNVYYATFLKWKFLTIDYIVPALLILGIINLFWLGYQQGKWKFIRPSIVLFIQKIEQTTAPMFIIILLLLIASEFFYYLSFHGDKKIPFKIGISQWNNNITYLEAIKGFKAGLAENGFKENQNVLFYYENPNADFEKQINIIQSFVNQKFDLIYTLAAPGTLIARGVTKHVPIVFSFVAYPEEMNLINSLRSSQNNLVGSRNYIPASQQFYFFEQLYPHIKTLGFVHHKGDESSEIQFKEYQLLLNKRNIQLIDLAVIDMDHLLQLLQESKRYDTLYLACDSFMQSKGGEIVINISRKKKIPTFSCNKNNVLEGVLMGYVADPYEIGKIAGRKAAFILQGAEPAWLYTESPERGYLIINMTTARLLGITVPDSMLQKSDYIIGQ